MAKRKYKVMVVKRLILEFRYDPLSEGVPSDAALREPIIDALPGAVDRGAVISLDTATERVPIEEQADT